MEARRRSWSLPLAAALVGGAVAGAAWSTGPFEDAPPEMAWALVVGGGGYHGVRLFDLPPFDDDGVHWAVDVLAAPDRSRVFVTRWRALGASTGLVRAELRERRAERGPDAHREEALAAWDRLPADERSPQALAARLLVARRASRAALSPEEQADQAEQDERAALLRTRVDVVRAAGRRAALVEGALAAALAAWLLWPAWRGGRRWGLRVGLAPALLALPLWLGFHPAAGPYAELLRRQPEQLQTSYDAGPVWLRPLTPRAHDGLGVPEPSRRGPAPLALALAGLGLAGLSWACPRWWHAFARAPRGETAVGEVGRAALGVAPAAALLALLLPSGAVPAVGDGLAGGLAVPPAAAAWLTISFLAGLAALAFRLGRARAGSTAGPSPQPALDRAVAAGEGGGAGAQGGRGRGVSRSQDEPQRPAVDGG